MVAPDSKLAECLMGKSSALIAQTQRRQEVKPIFSFDLFLFYDEGVLNYTSEIIYESEQAAKAAASEIKRKIGSLIGRFNYIEVRVQEGRVVQTVYRYKTDCEEE